MKLTITTGTYDGPTISESHRWTIEVADEAKMADVLEKVKQECVPSIPVLNRPATRPHLYLVLAETYERADESKTVKDYALANGSMLQLMSAVR